MPKSSRRNVKTWPSEVLCSELVEVCSGGEAIAANLEAISAIEAVILCDTAMRRGRTVLVKADSWDFPARVTGCRKEEMALGYRVLLVFRDPFRWNRQIFCPEHMLDLGEMVKTRVAAPEPAIADRAFAAGQ